MGGFFGTVSTKECVNDLFYGTDYNSHLGTMRGGMSTYSKETGFNRSIHNLECTYFRSAFEDSLDKFKGNAGIGIISDTDAQPLLMNSHLGRFAIVTVAKVNNKEELASKLLGENMHLSEFSSGKINQTELIGLLIIKGKTFVEGIENVFREVKGSCSLLLLTEDGIIAARDSWGRTPIVVGRKEAHGEEPQSLWDAKKTLTRYQANRHPSPILVSKSNDIWVLARLFVCKPTISSNCANPTKACRYARSYGCTTDSPPRHTKEST